MTGAKITEEQLSATFAALVTSQVWCAHLPFFIHVVPEMAAIQGIPDFVASSSNLAHIDPVMRTRLGQALAQPAVARVAAGLTQRAVHQEESLLRWTGYSRPVVRKALSVLRELELVEEGDGPTYALSPGFPETFFDMWAFEIKVSDWRRALFQALQYPGLRQRFGSGDAIEKCSQGRTSWRGISAAWHRSLRVRFF